jgi:hypothetical protein
MDVNVNLVLLTSVLHFVYLVTTNVVPALDLLTTVLLALTSSTELMMPIVIAKMDGLITM